MRVAMLFAVLVTAACTHHQPIRYAAGLANGEEVTASNHVGQSLPARVMHGPNGELQLYSPIGVLPDHQIARITTKSHGQGAIEGLGLGALIGGSVGALLFASTGDDECNNDNEGCWFQFSAGEKAVLGGVLLGGTGAVLGLIIGAASGSTTIYEDRNTRITPVGPQGSTAGITVTF